MRLQVGMRFGRRLTGCQELVAEVDSLGAVLDVHLHFRIDSRDQSRNDATGGEGGLDSVCLRSRDANRRACLSFFNGRGKASRRCEQQRYDGGELHLGVRSVIGGWSRGKK